MPRLLLGLFYLSYFTLQWQNSEGGEVTSKIMQLGDRLILTSPSFPSCCLDDFTYHVSLRCPSPCAFDILFIDVDLPETATLKVYTGMKAENNPIVTATYSENHGWTRPSQIHESLTNSITINSTVIPHQLLPQYSGVKVQIEVFNSVRQRKASITSVDVCKSVHSVRRWKGGEVKVTPVYSTSDIKPKVDCLWVLKQPEGASENLQVYVRFTYTDELHGLLAVRNGSNSEAKALFYVDTDNKDASEAAIMHGKEGFTSTGSLYVRLRKPSETGHLTFVYGLFYRLDKQDKADTSCDMNGKSDGGFFCAGSSWCIPKADWCDGVRHCPSGEDEKDCPVLPSTTTTTTTTQSTTPSTTSVRPTVARRASCGPNDMECEDGSCVPIHQKCRISRAVRCARWERRCSDGSCAMRMLFCSEDCRPGQKYCSRPKRCIDFGRSCSGEPCPSVSPMRCGNKCYGEIERCNEHIFCDDAEDEKNCSHGPSFPWYAVLAGIGGMVLALAAMCLKEARKRMNTNRADPIGSPQPGRIDVPHAAGMSPPQPSRINVPHAVGMSQPQPSRIDVPHASGMSRPHPSRIDVLHASGMTRPHPSRINVPHALGMTRPQPSRINVPHASGMTHPYQHVSIPAVTTRTAGVDSGVNQETPSPTTPLMQNMAPPPCYNEALQPTYDPQPPPSEPLPPSYESVATTNR